MELLTLPDIKLHLRIDGDVEDTLLTAYATSAEEYLQQYTGRTFTAATLPAMAKVCLLMIISTLYENRESETTGRQIGTVENKLVNHYLERLRDNISV